MIALSGAGHYTKLDSAVVDMLRRLAIARPAARQRYGSSGEDGPG